MFVGVVPYAAPSNVQARLLENSTIILTWEPPPTELQNGELIGYMVSAEMVLLVWRTSVVYFMGVGISQVKPSNCFRPRKISFTFHF